MCSWSSAAVTAFCLQCHASSGVMCELWCDLVLLLQGSSWPEQDWKRRAWILACQSLGVSIALPDSWSGSGLVLDSWHDARHWQALCSACCTERHLASVYGSATVCSGLVAALCCTTDGVMCRPNCSLRLGACGVLVLLATASMLVVGVLW